MASIITRIAKEISGQMQCKVCPALNDHLSEVRAALKASEKREEQLRNDYKELQDLVFVRFGMKPWTPPTTELGNVAEATRERRNFQTGLDRMAKKQEEKSKEAWVKQAEKVAEFDKAAGIVTEEKK